MGICGVIFNKYFKCLINFKILDFDRNRIIEVFLFCNLFGNSFVLKLLVFSFYKIFIIFF